MDNSNDQYIPEFIAEATELLDKVTQALDGFLEASEKTKVIDSIFRNIHTVKGSSGIFSFTNTQKIAHELENHLSKLKETPDKISSSDLTYIHKETQKIKALITAHDKLGENGKAPEGAEPDSSLPSKNTIQTQEFIRVPVGTVNDMMNGIAEIFLIRNQMVYLLERFKSGKDERKDVLHNWEILDSSLRRGIGELERIAMGMRMMPVQGLFSRLSTVVSTYTKQSPNKKIRFVTQGESTELDKKVLDTLGEPLIHLIRNGMDHGIETSEERKQKRKIEVGTLTLSASIAVNEAIIELEDDGKGIDAQKLIQVAKDKGLDTSRITDEKSAIDLIFMPGFSTAEKITDVSGRGVGMDAVKGSVSSLGGRIFISTKVGEGTKFTIKLPVSMSLLPVVLVGINGYKYAIPNHDIMETRHVSLDQIKTNSGEEYYDFNGEIVPTLDLRKLFTVDATFDEEKSRGCPLVIFKVDGYYISGRVSTIEKNMELIVKPLPDLSPVSPFITGVSILPTGDPVFVLSMMRLREHIQKEGSSNAT